MLGEKLQLRGRLDALGNHLQPQPVTEIYHCSDQFALPIVAQNTLEESAVELDSIDRQFDQVRQAAVAGPEIVQCDADTGRVQCLDLADCMRQVAQRGVFGNLQIQLVGRHAELGTRLDNLIDKVVVLKAAGADVHRDLEPRPSLTPPIGKLLQRRLERERFQRAQNADASRLVQKSRRPQNAADRMAPAKQRLEAHHALFEHRHDRLVMHLELALGKPAPQFAFETQRGLDFTVLALFDILEQRHIASDLGRLHQRMLAVLQQQPGLLRIVGVDADAGAERDENFLVFEPDRTNRAAQQRLGPGADSVGIVQRRPNDHKIAIADAPQGAALADRLVNPLRHFAHDALGPLPTQRPVQHRETVDAKRYHGNSARSGSLDHLADLLDQHLPIRQTGGGVMQARVFQLRVRPAGALLLRLQQPDDDAQPDHRLEQEIEQSDIAEIKWRRIPGANHQVDADHVQHLQTEQTETDRANARAHQHRVALRAP